MSIGTPIFEAPVEAAPNAKTAATSSAEILQRDRGFTLIVASNDWTAAQRYESEAAGAVRQITLDALFEATAAQIDAGIASANMLLIVAPASASIAIGRFVERLRFAETARGVFGMRRFVVAAVLGDDAEMASESAAGATLDAAEVERRCREVCACGAQYAFHAGQKDEVAALLRSSASTHRAGRDRRKNRRFQDLKDVCIQTQDGSRQIAMVADESFSGIAVKVLDPTIFGYRARVSVFVAGAPMPAHVVRISGRDEQGRCLVALRWGTL